MRTKFISKIGSLAVAACIAFSSMPIFAAENKNIEVSFSDITNTANVLKGEAKVKVSVKGADGKATIAQMAFNFDGDLKYKSTQFLKGKNDPESGGAWTAVAGSGKKSLTASIVDTNGLDFSNEEDLFIITFKGEAGDKVTVNMSDFDDTYCTVNGVDRFPTQNESITLTASSKENVGKAAKIRLTMDKILSFTGSGAAGITVKISNENQKGEEITTVVENSSVSDGGHRDGKTSTPTFVVENTVVADDTYTVEVSGIGFITYKKEGVTFDDELKLTNDDFVPGDVNNDGKVDETDKKMVEKFIAENDYSIAADFNRDGKVNATDLKILGIKDDDKDETTDKDDKNDSNGDDSSNDSDGSGSGSGSDSGSGSSGGGGGFGGFGGGTTKEAFTDLADFDWAKDSIYTLKNKGIISGVTNTEFAPANNIKRGDFILILTRMLNIKDTFTDNFADVPADSYYYNAIGSAKAAGIAGGDGTNFMPEESITRQDLITLSFRAFLAKGYIKETDDLTVLDGFADRGEISDYAASAMASMVRSGIIMGSDGKVNPTGFATRAEVAVMCARMLKFM